MDIRYIDRFYNKNEWSEICRKTEDCGSFKKALNSGKISSKFNGLHENGISIACFGEGDVRKVEFFPVYFYKGNKTNNKDKIAAVVGTRRPTDQGRTIAMKAALYLSSNGYRVISDLSLGISSCVQKALLKKPFPGIAVIPCAVGDIYPRCQFELARKITLSGGVLIWLLPPSKSRNVFASDFKTANSFIASVSDIVLLVEATMKSGTRSLIESAADQGKDVFAWNSKRDFPQSQLPRHLIESGCGYFESVEELAVLAGFKPDDNRPVLKLTKEEKTILSEAVNEISIPLLVEKAGIPVKKALVIIADLEAKGLLEKTPGGKVVGFSK
ncbi:DNA-processing protein DprA [candidate division WOR-3 bacterium]|nr:DNA-processing protein DprA [candidate division WOR-3 bacterium]